MAEPAPDPSPHTTPDTPAEIYNRRLGLWLFLLYSSFYAAFVVLVVYDYTLMGKPVLAGLNLAIVYGMGLIFAAFILALVYMVMCRKEGMKEEG
jgi:uncharacterized membrane protein (DUF485 family)